VATPSLRPLSLGEILDAGIKVCTRHWKALALCVVTPVLPLAILQVLLIGSLDGEQLELSPEDDATTLDDVSTGFWVASGIGLVLQIILYLVVQTACFKAVSDAWLGATPSAGRSLRFGLKSAPRVFLLGLVLFPAVVLGFVLCIAPGIWLFVVWSLAVPAILFERVGPFKALGRSHALVDKRFWATLLLLLISSLLVAFLGGIITSIPSVVAEFAAPENHLAAAVANVVGTTVGNMLTYPYSAAVVAILYFDQRVRKEGFDVQMLAEGLGQSFDPDAPIPAPLQPGPYTPPPQGWQPQGEYGGWNVPSHQTAPLRWGPGAQAPPQDTRPPEESPWMAPGPGGWTPPNAGQSPPPNAGPSAPPPSSSAPPAGEPAPSDAARWGTPSVPRENSADAEQRWGTRSAPGQSPEDAVQQRWGTPSAPGQNPDDAVQRWGTPKAPPAGPGGSVPSRPDADAPPRDPGVPSGSPLADEDVPTDPLPPREDAPAGPPAGDAPSSSPPAAEDAPPTSDDPSWESRWGTQSPFGESPWEDKPDKEKRKDKDRADWQPPEEPRGPGGL